MSQAFDYLNDGDTIAFTAPTGGVTAWSGYVIGKLFLVAMQTALAGVVVSGRTKGVFSLPKVSAEVWTEGMAIYWDTNQNKATLVANSTAAGNAANLLIGQACLGNPTDVIAGSGAAVGVVRLIGDVNPVILEATATIDFTSISAQTSQDQTVTVPGAAVGDIAVVSDPSAINAGLTWAAFVSATDTVKVRLSNVTVGSIDPASASFTVKVLKS